MSSHQAIQPFRFLDLPGEIRNNVYDLLLCSWNDEPEHDPHSISKVSRRSLSYPASPLLRVSKQIHSEASDYMVKRNQFVRVTCRGLDVRNLFLEDGIPVVSANPHEVSRFQGYVMHMTLSKPMFAPSPFAFTEYEMMMLRADLPNLCGKLDVESVMTDANATTSEHTSLHASIKFNYAYSRFFTPKIQEHLLQPIATLLRGVPNLKITGPVDATLAKTVAEEVAKPRWTDPEATLGEIHTGVDVGKRQWQQNNYYTAAESWNYSMRTLERMRHSSSWLGLQKTGGEDFVNKTADLYFTLNLLSAAFLQVDMASDLAQSALIGRNGKASLHHLRKCETASARFAQHAGATWIPSNQQQGKMMYRQAKCLRLMRDGAARVKAVTLIEQAATLAPNDIAIRDEKDTIACWNEEIEEAMRSLEQQQIEVETVQNGSIWSSMWAAISELAA
ncbi:hypothetical protein HBI81_135140 [Parastagonospora nodorum]|nr:hypothetical protein HBI62_157170 [Parastagonospora nodorum]KAH6148395.1 hypothetical protein HBI63_150720 [Parastagonospora nodorum]KAH6171617.1 hypothetical protein HBI61_180140 [Parastagonospora nodorum]KAH6500822.1 hypothetical protein HBI55_049660 [Parastagonospora nodorum]KAH6524308.1 hypothetical protein HBI81_135140 [Parastagonospora nodorum]